MEKYEHDIDFDIILPHVKADNKKQVFSVFADALEKVLKIPAPMIAGELTMNEEKATSAQENGVAIPELKLKRIAAPVTILGRLQHPIEFEALDGKPVDIVCLVVSPQREGPVSLRRLSRITRLLRNTALCDRIRETDDEDSIRSLIYNPDGWMLAA